MRGGLLLVKGVGDSSKYLFLWDFFAVGLSSYYYQYIEDYYCLYYYYSI